MLARLKNPKSVVIYAILVNGPAVGVQINPSLIHDVFEIHHPEIVMYKEISCSVSAIPVHMAIASDGASGGAGGL